MFLMMKMFTLSLIVGSVASCMEAKNWWAYWLMLEINSLAFMLYMFKEKKKEKTFIFLIFQTFSSSMVMMFIFMEKWTAHQNMSKMVSNLIIVSIVAKIGMFPIHTWLISLVKNFSWMTMAILFTWQKMIPIMVVLKAMKKNKNTVKTLIVSMYFLNFILMKMSNAKILMTVSSLIHNTWMFTPLIIVKEISLAYLFSYAMVFIFMALNFMKNNVKNIMSQTMSSKISKEMKILILSISGIPPSAGFFMKMTVFICLMMTLNKPTLMFFIVSSCMSFFVYMQMFSKYFFNEKAKNMKKSQEQKNNIKEVSWVIMFVPMLLWL